MKKYFGTDGVRGRANLDLTPELALRLGRASAGVIGGAGKRIVIGRDTRISGPMLESAMVAGLLSEGAEVIAAEVIPTPAIAFLTEEIGADAGVVISASHNSYQDNGIKLLGPAGLKLSDRKEVSIEELLDTLRERDRGEAVGSLTLLDNAEDLYVEHLVECATADLSGFRVVLDCANGAAYRVCPDVFKRMGATVETIGVEPDGKNINLGCGSADITRLADAVTGWGADMGFALDGDADRCVCIDETGRVRDGDYVIAVAAKYLRESGLLHPRVVVTTVMSNLGLYRALEEMDVEYVQTKVGDRYVSEEIERLGALLGGEQSGHIIFREHSPTGDGTLTALLVAGMVSDTGEPLSELCGIMRKYPQVLVNVESRSGRRLEPGMRVWEMIESYQRALGGEGRVLVRSSGTEPVERVMVEAGSPEEAERVAGEIADAVRKELEH